jgi:hypothetical protein
MSEKRSLQDELKKRRAYQTSSFAKQESPATKTTTTNAVPSSDAAKQPARQTGQNYSVPQSANPPTKTQTIRTEFVKTTSQTVNVSAQTDQVGSVLQNLSNRQKTMILGGAIAVCLLMLVVLIFQPSPSEALTPIPVVSADQVVAYLDQVNVPILSRSAAAVENTVSAVQLQVALAGHESPVIIAGYADVDKASGELLKAQYTPNNPYQGWVVSQTSNILLMIPATAPVEFQREIGSHVSQFLLAPYRAFIPTATVQSE